MEDDAAVALGEIVNLRNEHFRHSISSVSIGDAASIGYLIMSAVFRTIGAGVA